MKTEYGVGGNQKMEVEKMFSKFIFPKLRVEKHPHLISHYGVSLPRVPLSVTWEFFQNMYPGKPWGNITNINSRVAQDMCLLWYQFHAVFICHETGTVLAAMWNFSEENFLTNFICFPRIECGSSHIHQRPE